MNMPDVIVVPVADKPQQEQFLRLPWSIYRDDGFWVPPQIDFQREVLFSKTHPFNESASCQSWLAYLNGQPVGRVSAIVNRLYLQRYAEPMGFFGFFESVDCPSVASRLFESASDWLEQQGIKGIRGPVQPSVHYEAGLLLNSCKPYFTSTYNPPYYARLLESCGFSCSQTMCTYSMNIEMLRGLDPKIEYAADEAVKRFDIRLRHFNSDHIEQDLRHYFKLYNLTMASMWSFVPLTEPEIERAIQYYTKILATELTVIAEVENQVVGVAMGVLDYHSAKPGRSVPADPLETPPMRRNQTGIRRSRMFSAHVLPQYKLWGVGPAMMMFVLRAGIRMGIELMETSWVEDDNDVSKRTLLRVGAKPRAKYAFFEWIF